MIRKKIGSMYLGVCTKEDKMTVYGLCHSVMFLLRRTIFVIITFTFYDMPAIQLQVFILSSILSITYLSFNRIFDDQFSF